MSTDSRRTRLESLVSEALGVDPAEREAFIREQCEGDDELAADALSLCARDNAMTTDFLESPAGDANVLGAAHSGERARIGPYTILDTLGEGGFGVVYLAEQSEPVRRRVALKVIKPGMDSKAVLARFEAERQALALMDHPNIAKVHDAGTTERGMPYFVMERVKGTPITEFCDLHKVGIHERINIFIDVCDAIQHAHQKGLVHRDIKPSNILIEYENEKITPKVIDFGVAKALNQKLTEKTIFTEQGQLIGTPEYMSPEQAEMSELDIDTRADIYSLGVLLYELLTGRLPFEPDELRSAGYAEIQRIIREVDPPKPSTRLSTMLGSPESSEAISAIVASRATTQGELPKRLRGDLDWIVMRCLEKSRIRRYATANGVAEELKRYLKNEPVLAGPPGLGYRTRKFVRRNRAGVIAASIVLIVLTAGFAGTTYGLFEANAAREAEAEQRTIAEQRADDLQVITDFQSEMLSRIDPEEMGLSMVQRLRDDARTTASLEGASDEAVERLISNFEAVTTRANPTNAAAQALDEQILSRAIETINEQFSEQPLTDAALRSTVAVIYLNLGIIHKAEPQFELAQSTYRRELGDDDPKTLESINNVAAVSWLLGRHEEAETLFRQTLETRLRVLGEEHPDTLSSMHNVSILYRAQGRFEEAQPLDERVLELRRRILGDEHPDTLQSMIDLAISNEYQGRDTEAESLYKELLETMRRVLGDDHPDTMSSMYNLAAFYKARGRYTEARPYDERSLELKRRIYGDEHPETIRALHALANLNIAQDALDDAKPLLAELITIRIRLAERQDATANDKNECAWELLTTVHEDLRDPALALRFATDACEMTGHVDPNFMDTLALAQHLTGDTPAALETQRRAIALLPEGIPRDDPTRIALEESLAAYEGALQDSENPVETGEQ